MRTLRHVNHKDYKKTRRTRNSSLGETLTWRYLSEAPTNNTSNVYLKEPEYTYSAITTPEAILDFNADDAAQYGTDTSGIFDEFGNSIVIDPPGTWEIPPGPTTDPSHSLGPMVSYYDSVANRTYLGYVRQSDRSMINLGRIDGQLSNWDQSSNFTSYGQLTLAQAQWYYGEYTANRVQNYRVSYSGKYDATDPYGRVNAKAINTPKGEGDNPWVIKTTSPIADDTPITIKFYLDNQSNYTGSRQPIFYDSNGSVPAGLNVYDTVNFTLPAGQQFVLQQGGNSGNLKIGSIGLKWGYTGNYGGHPEPDGDENGAGNGDDYFNWQICVNGKCYQLPNYLLGIGAAIGIPGGFGGWSKGNPNTKGGAGAQKTTQKQGNKNSGFDPNLAPGSAQPKKKNYTINDFKSAADYSAFKAGGGNAALNNGKTVQQIINTGKYNLGSYGSGSNIPDPYKLTSSEKSYLNNILKTQGYLNARDAQVDLEVKKLEKLNSVGKLTTQQKVDLVALKASQGYSAVAKAADKASEYLGYLMLAKDVAGLAGKGISAGIGAAIKSGLPKGLSSAGLEVGATGLNKAGYEAIIKGEPYIASNKPQVLGPGAYQSPKVGKTGGLLGGTGGAKYGGTQGSLGGAQEPGGVVASLTPKGAPKIPFIEPQAKVPTTTFDKGAKIVKDIQGGKYPTSAKAQQIQQQLDAAGFPKGQSSIPYSQLPKVTGPSASTLGKLGAVGATLAGLSQLQGDTPQSGPGSNQAKIQQVLKNPTIQNMGADQYSAFKAGGGEAALKQQGGNVQALANIIAQGKANLGSYDTSSKQTSSNVDLLGAGAAGALVGGLKISPSWTLQQANNAVSNVSDYNDIIKNPKIGLGKNYSLTDWSPSKEGLKATITKNGQPVLDPTGKPYYVTASGVDNSGSFTSHGKGQQTTGNNVKKIINQIKEITPATETGVTVTKTPAAKPGEAAKTKYVNYTAGSGPKPESGTPSNFKSWSQVIDDVEKAAGKAVKTGAKVAKTLKLSHEMQGNPLMERRQRIARNIKSEVVLPEEKKEKIKHRPRVIGAPPRTVGADLMKKVEVPTSFKPMDETMWGKHERYMNAKASQERKNQILDYLGTSDEAWEWITEVLRKRANDVAYQHFNNDKLKEDVLHNSRHIEEQETMQADKDPLFKKVSKRLKQEIDYPDKPSKAGYPDNPPPKMVDGFHPDFGEKGDYYKTLDPDSANMMPSTGNQNIDTNMLSLRDNQKRADTLKRLLGKR